jgi:hypothetical protein
MTYGDTSILSPIWWSIECTLMLLSSLSFSCDQTVRAQPPSDEYKPYTGFISTKPGPMIFHFASNNIRLRTVCLYTAFGKSLFTYKGCWKWCPRASIQPWTRLILFANTFCSSDFGKSLCTYKWCWKWCLRAYLQAWSRSLRAQRFSERTVSCGM